MKAKEGQNPTKYARELHAEYNCPKYLSIASIAKRYRDGERDIEKLIALPMTRQQQGRKGAKNSPVNPYNPEFLKKRTI